MAENNNIQIQFDYLDLEKCFKNFYVVPDYQREYVWEERQVNQLLSDVYDEFDNNHNKEYFIGSTVVFKDDNGSYELIDGQQRTTTLFLIICALKKVYTRYNLETDTLDRMIKDKTVNALGDSIDKYKLELQYKDSSNILNIISSLSERPANLKGSAERLYNAYENIVAFLTQNFREDKPNQLKGFFVYLYRKLKFIQIETPEINDALKIFETINERGIGLNPMDLLKNLIFRQVDRKEFTKLNTKWQQLVSILDKNNEKPLRFLRYFIMANYNVNSPKGDEILREDEIYKWITKPENAIQCNYEKEPFDFVALLIENAEIYVKYFKGEDQIGQNIFLNNIRKLGGGSFRQHLILLLAGRKLPKPLFDHLAKQIETLIFFYFITREPTKEFERNFSKWAKNLKNIKTEEELDHFIKNKFEPAVNEKKNSYKNSFLELNQNSVQQYRMRYILAKIAQYVDLQRLGSYNPQTLDSYITTGIELEHILPYKPDIELREKIGEEYDEVKIKLGNLTLLEKSINASIGNKDFYNHKVSEYSKSAIYLTKSISVLENVGTNTAITRINQRLKTFSNWDISTIAERQEMLFDLSKSIWKVDYMNKLNNA
ncbi:DUF262 domain-containing HNH endonuclease family protein [Psychroflexus sp. CAK57W]|uniref:DUF262 domain-containing protein n=1 Tax=Psychroflexus curvus TaxID=2873595 RepID=UPI001CCCF5CA|nr:DUF262 domain-containing protein [Psychroflexus curvus]MBZ9788205.1 DUF262 domain-containing HNH endonuclease family protein [Psychroflexus curvus]